VRRCLERRHGRRVGVVEDPHVVDADILGRGGRIGPHAETQQRVGGLVGCQRIERLDPEIGRPTLGGANRHPAFALFRLQIEVGLVAAGCFIAHAVPIGDRGLRHAGQVERRQIEPGLQRRAPPVVDPHKIARAGGVVRVGPVDHAGPALPRLVTACRITDPPGR